MHDAMPHRGQGHPSQALLDPIHQRAYGRRMVRRRQRPREVVCLARTLHPQGGVGQPNPLDRALETPPGRGAPPEEREFDARGAAIDRQDARVSALHK